jgi:hypothetical protein
MEIPNSTKLKVGKPLLVVAPTGHGHFHMVKLSLDEEGTLKIEGKRAIIIDFKVGPEEQCQTLKAIIKNEYDWGELKNEIEIDVFIDAFLAIGNYKDRLMLLKNNMKLDTFLAVCGDRDRLVVNYYTRDLENGDIEGPLTIEYNREMILEKLKQQKNGSSCGCPK